MQGAARPRPDGQLVASPAWLAKSTAPSTTLTTAPTTAPSTTLTTALTTAPSTALRGACE